MNISIGLGVGVMVTGCALATLACAVSRAPHNDKCAKVPEGTDLAPKARARDLAGSFRIVLVGESSEFRGDRVEGTLELLTHDSAAQAVVMPDGVRVEGATMPLYGALDAAIEQVGGSRVGEATSLDPSGPGVAVFEQALGAPADSQLTITLRVGSDANRSGVIRFDGAFMALYVKNIGPLGFRGSWSSGGRGPVNSGYFCASRRGGE